VGRDFPTIDLIAKMRSLQMRFIGKKDFAQNRSELKKMKLQTRELQFYQKIHEHKNHLQGQ
jgi:hypothetical protein